MEIKELKGVIAEMDIENYCTDIIDNAIGTLMLDSVAMKNLTLQLRKMPTYVKGCNLLE